ncbi:hypothetical protein HDU90_006492 [Geranomyces variabilis]|nr:hypothetical protein HDU90_006492 [Geranomyces variabilis]
MHFVKLALLSFAAVASAQGTMQAMGAAKPAPRDKPDSPPGQDKKQDKDKPTPPTPGEPISPQERANYALVTKFWDNFMYPKNKAVVTSKDAGGILSDDIKGRVDITRTFSGKELNTEYLFGTFSGLVPANQFQFVARPVNYTIVQFASTGNVASTSVIVNFQDLLTGSLEPLQIDSYTSYNSKGQIQQYDAIFRRYPWFLQTAVQAKAGGLLALYHQLTGTALTPTAANVNVAMQALLANSICQTHTISCTADLAQYSSQQECYNFLTQNVPLGEGWQAGQNNVLCRAIHQNMIPLRPAEHCPHIGKTGGGMCVDVPYASVFEPFYQYSWNAFQK